MKKNNGLRRRQGFSLIELMVVITIIGILGGIVGANVFTYLKEAQKTTTMSQMRNIEAALKTYKLTKRKLPDSLQELIDAELLETEGIPADAWGNEIYYQKEGSNDFQLISYGADGVEGGEGENEDIDRKALRDANKTDDE